MPTVARRLIVPILLIVAAVVFGTGINWGLPSRENDVFLLGKQRDNLHLESLTAAVPEVDASHGADVVAAAGPADQVVPLNDTDLKKAQILCRYRLYSFQPDEMITFRSLSQMKPRQGDFDPRLYQYGGLWIYGVGAITELGHAVGLVDITDRATYIGNPELFGKFYVAARAYSAAWGLVGVWAVYLIVRRLSGGGIVVPLISALCFIAMPVVITTAHEAKPHLAGCVLILLAALVADQYLRTRKTRWLWITGIACGAAAGMVLWGAVALLLIPIMAAMARKPSVIVSCTITALLFYAVSNPYVVVHLFHDPSVLESNLGNTSAMYHIGRPGTAIWTGLHLICAGTGPLLMLVGLIGSVALFSRRPGPLAVFLSSVAIVIAIPFVIMAAGKPGEYGRFALLPDIALLIIAAAVLSRFKRAGLAILLVVVGATLPFGYLTLSGFIRDAGAPRGTSRWAAASQLQTIFESRRSQQNPHPTLGVYADPAPYGLPPVDLDGWRIVRLPASFDREKALSVAEVVVRADPTIDARQSPISWADKKFEVSERPLKR